MEVLILNHYVSSSVLQLVFVIVENFIMKLSWNDVNLATCT